MKKLILFAALYCLQPALHAAPVDAHERAMTHFKANYTEAQDAIWYNQPDNIMYCIFHTGSVINRVYYDKHGRWMHTLKGYTSPSLDKNVKEMVLMNYLGYHITYVNEVRSIGSDPVFMINIENEDNIKIIKVVGEEMEVTQDLEKNSK